MIKNAPPSREKLQQHVQRALALQQAGQLDAAERIYKAVLRADPREVNALQLLGLIEKRRGRLDAAELLMRHALAQSPDEPAILNNLGNTLREKGRLDDAADCLGRAVSLRPGYTEAWNNLGNVAKDQGDYRQAAEHYRRALDLQPDYVDALNNLGGVLHRLGDLSGAAARYRAALAGRPGFAMAHYNLANVLTDAGMPDQAIAHFRAALRAEPDYVEAVSGLLRQLQTVCEWGTELPELCARLRRLGQASGKVFPFAFLAVDSTLAEQQQCARRWVERQYAAHRQHQARHPFAHPGCAPGARLRIGYLSSDLHDHATAWLMAEVFELHDRAAFEVHAFSLGPDDGGAMRARLRRGFDHFHELRGLPWPEVARRIHAAGIHILVDLKGYTKDTGAPVLAYRPAPVQVSYLGYPGTLGADFADWVVTDPIVSPPAHRRWYDEAYALLPHCYQANDRHRAIGPRPSRADCGLPEAGVVYACFNHTYKITPEVFADWCHILAQVPGSVLWLLKSNRWAETNLRREAEALGVAPERLVFADNKPLAEHLGRLQNADLFLDTRPYNAHTTGSDALWAGVPLLTWPGDTFASRVGASLVSAVGLPELIAADRADYRRRAIALGLEPAALAALRAKLGRQRHTAPLFDSPAFTRALESLYHQMWARHAAGQPPADLHAEPAAVACPA